MDIMSDLLVLSLPVSILWKVRISIRQKVGLGFSLCLSCVMVIVTIVRIAGMRLRPSGSVDIVWLVFWQQQECSIAVLMMSVSAFRSLFIQNPTNHPVHRQQGHSPSEKRRRFLHRRPDPNLYAAHETNGLPQIPSATLTGMTRVVAEDGHAEDTAELDQHFDGHRPPLERNGCTEITTSGSSAQDSELGHLTELILPDTRRETSDGKQGRSRGAQWWKGFVQPEAARTASITRTGYWDVMSLFRTGHSESVIHSNDRSNGQL